MRCKQIYATNLPWKFMICHQSELYLHILSFLTFSQYVYVSYKSSWMFTFDLVINSSTKSYYTNICVKWCKWQWFTSLYLYSVYVITKVLQKKSFSPACLKNILLRNEEKNLRIFLRSIKHWKKKNRCFVSIEFAYNAWWCLFWYC